ncbi:MAG: nuclear transport factor 2 family protein [Chloroflexi bacterium]|nr:nuclear transport factor 2 family protein [Chloroflexota bacterium]
MSDKFRALYDRQLAILADKDHVRLIDENYTEDAQLLSYTTHVSGAEALKEYFKGYIAQLGYLKLLSTDKYAEGDDSLMFEAHAETAGGIAHVYDVFIIRDGRISHHFTGLISFTPKAQS